MGDEVAGLAGERHRVFPVEVVSEVEHALGESEHPTRTVGTHAVFVRPLHVVDAALLRFHVFQGKPDGDRVAGSEVVEVAVLVRRCRLSAARMLVEVLHVDRFCFFAQANVGQCAEFAWAKK